MKHIRFSLVFAVFSLFLLEACAPVAYEERDLHIPVLGDNPLFIPIISVGTYWHYEAVPSGYSFVDRPLTEDDFFCYDPCTPYDDGFCFVRIVCP